MHNSVAKGPFTMPLNIGFISAYAKRYFGQDVEFKLFKYPLEIIHAIKEKTPDILALGNYAWNTDLNHRITEFAKMHSKESIVIFGGPNFPIEETEQGEYLRQNSLIDFYVTNQGEPGFLNLLKRILEEDGCLGRVKTKAIDGCVFLNGEEGGLVAAKSSEPFSALDDIPSPYLTGILDSFFNANLIPLIETDRGCPYTCTFCAWGKTTNREVKQFDIERVKAEIDYIVKHVKYMNLLSIANANFGIFERDKEIAEYIKKQAINSGYPRKVTAAWAKNTPKRIIDMVEALGDMVEITMSFQSLDQAVLGNVRRSNIRTDMFMEIQDHFAKKGIYSASEIILGLPGETKESHLSTLKRLFDIKAGNVVCYNCRTLGGTVLDTKEQRSKYGIKTRYRLFDVGFGKYGDIVSIEADEVIHSTNTMSEEDILFFRAIHWLIQFLWSYRYYIDLLKYLQSELIHPIDFMLRIISDVEAAPMKIKQIMRDFQKETESEWFDTKEGLFNYYSREDNFAKIMAGGFGKLNYKYMFKILCEGKDEFDSYLSYIAKKMLKEKDGREDLTVKYQIIDDLLRYAQSVYVKFDDELCFDKEKTLNFNYDIVAWQKNGYKGRLADYRGSKEYLFYMPDDQDLALRNNLKQFKHEDKNATLRKMSEYMKKTDLFYKISTLKRKQVKR